jgi:hypothetical protein
MKQPANGDNLMTDSSDKTMSLEEARKVMWLRNNFRPLGELLDEGYLNQARLEWAATKAYDLRLKQAAQVLLDWQKETKSEATIDKTTTTLTARVLDEPVPVGITMEKARTTKWPFPPFKDQPMGRLVETRQLSLKDLGYAAENAWDERVRLSAMALMLWRMNQAVKEPTPSAGPLNVVSGGRSYAERQQFHLTLLEGLLLGFVSALVGYLSIWLITRQPSGNTSKPLSELFVSPSSIVSFVLALTLVLGLFGALAWAFNFLFNQIMNRLDKAIENHRKGQDGEDRAVEVLRQTLDGDWSLFRNIALPGRKRTDLDVVLVGPPGVWVLEIKTLARDYRNIGDRWEYRAGNSWKLSGNNPSRQANDNAIRLKNFLKADGIKQWVTPAVVWANPESTLMVENPAIAVWSIDRLPDEVGNIWHGESVSEVTRNQITEKLTRLCQEQEARESRSFGHRE